jgi:hypothetical protein
LKLVHSMVLQNVTERVDLAFRSYFRRVREGAEDVGYPRFKSFGRYDSMTYPQYGNGVRLAGERLILRKLERSSSCCIGQSKVHQTVTLSAPLRASGTPVSRAETEAHPLAD